MNNSSQSGFKQTMLSSANTTAYEPRATFQARYKQKDLMTNNQYAINQGGRYVHYHPNGAGRDTYIHNSNGGFTIMYKNVKWPEKGAI